MILGMQSVFSQRGLGIPLSLLRTKEIVSRKYAQLSEITEETAIRYLKELKDKYSPCAVIADVASNQVGANAGIFEELGGSLYPKAPELHHRRAYLSLALRGSKHGAPQGRGHEYTLRADWELQAEPLNSQWQGGAAYREAPYHQAQSRDHQASGSKAWHQ